MAPKTTRIIDDSLLELHTSQPGRVVAFYADTYEVDVELVCKRPVPHAAGGYVYEDPPVIPRCPVCAFGNDQSFMRLALKKGDLVWLLSPEVSTDEFVDTGELAQPSNVTRHGLLGSLAIPFVLPSKTPAGHLVSLAGGADFVALAAKVDANFKEIKDMFSGWTPVPNDGGAALKTLSDSLSLSSTAATKVKAT